METIGKVLASLAILTSILQANEKPIIRSLAGFTPGIDKFSKVVQKYGPKLYYIMMREVKTNRHPPMYYGKGNCTLSFGMSSDSTLVSLRYSSQCGKEFDSTYSQQLSNTCLDTNITNNLQIQLGDGQEKVLSAMKYPPTEFYKADEAKRIPYSSMRFYYDHSDNPFIATRYVLDFRFDHDHLVSISIQNEQ